MKIKLKILILLIIILCPTVFADNTAILVRDAVRKELQAGNKEILNKIQLESDLCYKNVEDAASSYFWELREDFRRVYWIDRIITFIGIFVSVLLAFMVSYFILRRFERKKEVVEHGR